MTFLKRIAGAAALGAAMLGSSLISSPVQAGYVVTLQEVGSDVVATGSGPIDLTGLSPAGYGSSLTGITPFSGYILTGPAFPPPASFDIYTGLIGPASFGSSGFASV